MRSLSRWTIYSMPLAGLLLAASPRYAPAVSHTLTFEGLQNFESVNNYYDGLFGANNANYAGPVSGPGPNYGVLFTTPLAPADHGGQALWETAPLSNFMNEPSFQTILFDLNNDTIDMTVADKITGVLSFWYTGDAAGAAFDTVKLFGDSGPIVPTFVADSRNYTVAPPPGEPAMAIIGATVELPGIPNSPQADPNKGGAVVGNTVWDFVTIGFPGNANIVEFTGAGNHFGLDDITINTVPEPATAAVLLAGLTALALHRRRHR